MEMGVPLMSDLAFVLPLFFLLEIKVLLGTPSLVALSSTQGEAPVAITFLVNESASFLDWGNGGGQGACSPAPCVMSALYTKPGTYKAELIRFECEQQYPSQQCDSSRYMRRTILGSVNILVVRNDAQ
jgi:hypothetical protein